MSFLHFFTSTVVLADHAEIDHLTKSFHLSPPDGSTTRKQSRSAKFVCVCSISHLTATIGTKRGAWDDQTRFR